MNDLEISAFIAAKKKSRIYIEREVQAAQNLLADMKTQRPVRWYHNVYYVFKRILFILLSSLALLVFVSTFTAPGQYRSFFDAHYDRIVSDFLNDNFGSHSEVVISETSATDQNIIKTKMTREIRSDLREKLVGQVFDSVILILQILTGLLVVTFWYMARLTRQLHLKNKKISEHYQINLNLLDLYSEVVSEQKYEIDFLTNATGRKS